jgi:DNA-binding NtrC family response regulator
VRELENLIERAVVLTRGDVIALTDLPLTLQEPSSESTTPGDGLVAAVEGLERRMIREALNRSEGIQTRAAEQLGISERVLRYKLRKYGLTGE